MLKSARKKKHRAARGAHLQNNIYNIRHIIIVITKA